MLTQETFYQKFANTPLEKRHTMHKDENLLKIYESLQYLEARKKYLLELSEEIFEIV
jgi:hypothetical protein